VNITRRLLIGLLAIGTTVPAALAADAASDVAAIPANLRTPLYPGNRDPLRPSPLVKLPIGAIRPQGWLLEQLRLSADGMTGRLPEVSTWCKFDGNAWTDPHRQGRNGWEEVPYWLKGFGDLGYVLGDQRIIKENQRWVDAIIAAQADDGWFGPDGLRTANDGKPDLWPHMPILNALQSNYEYTTAQGHPDERIIKLMQRYFRWELNCPDDQFMHGYWPLMRTGDNLESVYWLYNRTGERWLLELAAKIDKHTPNWISSIPMWHNVNLAQGFREPAEFWMQNGSAKYLAGTQRAYDTVMDRYGQVPGGGFCADEMARPGFTDPRQGFETCGMVEYMHSFEMLTRITGSPAWADRCEDVALNDFPAALTPDLKGLHYLTSPNSVQLDQHNKHPDIDDRGEMISYSPGGAYRCCQHNHGMGWPYYAEELWGATSDGGLAASLYAPSTVTAKVNGGARVMLSETTDYPFGGVVKLALSWDQGRPATPTFPLYLRVPHWADGATVKVNDQPVVADAKPESYLVLNRTWHDGDSVELALPMHVSVRRWVKNKDSASVDYGPLTFALAVGEKWETYGDIAPGWPTYDVYATTPWNYGLVLDDADPAKGFTVTRRPGPVPPQPFTPESVPLTMTGPAKRIPNWQKDRFDMVGLLAQSPVRSDEPTETVSLIPMGADRLRISQFPVIGTGPDAHDWPAAPPPLPFTATASHTFAGDTTDALCDGIVPAHGSADTSIPRFTWWDHRGSAEWVQYDFAAAKKVGSVEVYWYDDAKNNGQCRPPASWQVQYRDAGGHWVPVEAASPAGVADDTFNRVTFTPVTTTGLRLAVQLQDGFSGGILEWRVGE
jgi:hypothetical protein